jgi:predicted transposase/invertase (TIGR01784 family)
MEKGQSYEQVVKVITISLVYFDLGQGQDYVYHGNTRFVGYHHHDVLQLSEAQKKLFNRPAVEAIFPDHYIIRVNEFNDIARDSLDEWIYFFKNSEIKEEFKARGLAEAREKLKEINLEGIERAAYISYLEQLSYEASIAKTIKFEEQFGKEKAREEGLKEGREEGLKEGQRSQAKTMAALMKKEGEEPDKISRYTGLSLEEIQKL